MSCFKALEEKYETVLVEGAGGLMVPVTSDLLTSDLIASMSSISNLPKKAGIS